MGREFLHMLRGWCKKTHRSNRSISMPSRGQVHMEPAALAGNRGYGIDLFPVIQPRWPPEVTAAPPPAATNAAPNQASTDGAGGRIAFRDHGV